MASERKKVSDAMFVAMGAEGIATRVPADCYSRELRKQKDVQRGKAGSDIFSEHKDERNGDKIVISQCAKADEMLQLRKVRSQADGLQDGDGKAATEGSI